MVEFSTLSGRFSARYYTDRLRLPSGRSTLFVNRGEGPTPKLFASVRATGATTPKLKTLPNRK
jgi:hypothetical protein